MHGWFSEGQKRVGGTCFYSTPDGGQVEVTQVTETKEHGTKWEDMTYLGEVVDFLEAGEEGPLDEIDFMNTNAADSLKKLQKIIESELRAQEREKNPLKYN